MELKAARYEVNKHHACDSLKENTESKAFSTLSDAANFMNEVNVFYEWI